MSPFNNKENKYNSSRQSIEQRKLILYNDNENTFNHVMDALKDVCEHDELQAEQCAVLTHLRGSCEIKQGNFAELLIIENLLSERMLNVSIN